MASYYLATGIINRFTGKGAKISYTTLEFLSGPPMAKLTLSCPENGNLINAAMAAEIRQACQVIGEDDGLVLALLTGSGACFSVGLDTGEDTAGKHRPDEHDPAGSPDVAFSPDLHWIHDHQAASALASLPIPVIVAINGDAFDHGLELALAGDIRIAAQDARFGFTGLAQGVLPWDGGTQRLPRLVGTAWGRDMLLTGRVVDSTEALAMGLINRVAPREQLMAEAQRLAESIAAGGPVAARYVKEAVLKGMDLSLNQGLGLEADLNVLLHGTGDRAEGIRSFLDRSPPRFSGS